MVKKIGVQHYPPIILGIFAIVLIAYAFGVLPGEVAGFMCIITPAAMAGWIGFVVGRYGRPRVSFPEAKSSNDQS